MTSNRIARHAGLTKFLMLPALLLLGGCSSLLPPPPPADNVYLLEAGPALAARPTPRGDAAVIAVSLPRARAGYDTTQMLWFKLAHELRPYSRSRWADTPARMLAPQIADALERSGQFHAVVRSPSTASAPLRLDTELVRLQQDFSVQPSRVQFAMGAQLLDMRTRQVIASAEFEETENAESEDAYGGVQAANRALERLLARLTEFCVQHAPSPESGD